MCENNLLTSLKGAPRRVGQPSSAWNEGLTSLRYLPRQCAAIVTDRGKFSPQTPMPEDARATPASLKRLERGRTAAHHRAAVAPYTLLKPATVHAPLKLKKKRPQGLSC